MLHCETLAGTRVLIVEDEAMIAMLLEDMLEAFDCVVAGRAARLAAARALIANERFDCAILDVNVGGEYVWPMAETLAARDIPFLFVTGYGRPELAAPFRDRPMLQKPFRAANLKRALTDLVGRK